MIAIIAPMIPMTFKKLAVSPNTSIAMRLGAINDNFWIKVVYDIPMDCVAIALRLNPVTKRILRKHTKGNQGKVVTSLGIGN